MLLGLLVLLELLALFGLLLLALLELLALFGLLLALFRFMLGLLDVDTTKLL